MKTSFADVWYLRWNSEVGYRVYIFSYVNKKRFWSSSSYCVNAIAIQPIKVSQLEQRHMHLQYTGP